MTDDTKRTDGTSTGQADAMKPEANATAQQAADGRDAIVDTLKAEVAELKDRVLRTHAEMENMRKRSEREKADTLKYAVSRFAQDMLSVGDNVQRAINAVPPEAAEQDPVLKSFLEGVTMTERELLNVFERNGIKRMSPQGEIFNPHHHQAVMETQNPEVPSGTVVQVLQPGYLIEDRVLRPAMVVVAKGGAKAPQPESAQPEGANDDAEASEAGQGSRNGQGAA
jgi:molecular chaperone GrpE